MADDRNSRIDRTDRNGWTPLLKELEERRAAARAMGGAERVKRLMTDRGKLDARKRIELLFDPVSGESCG